MIHRDEEAALLQGLSPSEIAGKVKFILFANGGAGGVARAYKGVFSCCRQLMGGAHLIDKIFINVDFI